MFEYLKRCDVMVYDEAMLELGVVLLVEGVM
jgi:hypothetical protein